METATKHLDFINKFTVIEESKKRTVYCISCLQKRICKTLSERLCCLCTQRNWLELKEEELLSEQAQKLLDDYQQKMIDCKCSETNNAHLSEDLISCEACYKMLKCAGHHQIVKNRNNTAFWKTGIEERILCLRCLGEKYLALLDKSKRHTFFKYLRRGYV